MLSAEASARKDGGGPCRAPGQCGLTRWGERAPLPALGEAGGGLADSVIEPRISVGPKASACAPLICFSRTVGLTCDGAS